MKRLLLGSMLSCLAITHMQASEIVDNLIDGSLWTAVGVGAVVGGGILGMKGGERLSTRFNYVRPTFAGGFYVDGAVGGLLGWCATYAAKKMLNYDSTASTVGMVTGLAGVPVGILAAFCVMNYVAHNPLDNMTPIQRLQHRQQIYASLTQGQVRELINANSYPLGARLFYNSLSEEQRGWVEPEVVTALQLQMQGVTTGLDAEII